VVSCHAWFVGTVRELTTQRSAAGALINIDTSSKRGVPLEPFITVAVISANSIFALSLVISWAVPISSLSSVSALIKVSASGCFVLLRISILAGAIEHICSSIGARLAKSTAWITCTVVHIFARRRRGIVDKSGIAKANVRAGKVTALHTSWRVVRRASAVVIIALVEIATFVVMIGILLVSCVTNTNVSLRVRFKTILVVARSTFWVLIISTIERVVSRTLVYIFTRGFFGVFVNNRHVSGIARATVCSRRFRAVSVSATRVLGCRALLDIFARDSISGESISADASEVSSLVDAICVFVAIVHTIVAFVYVCTHSVRIKRVSLAAPTLK
jgi:hypothetical protein